MAAGSIPELMYAVVTVGNGGYDMLEYKQVPTPKPKTGEVLVQVLAAGVNNTEINTRLGWYSKAVKVATSEEAGANEEAKDDGGWSGKTPFPLIQGTDCCGRVVSAGDENAEGVLGKRVLIRSCQRGPEGFASSDDTKWMASDFDGAFAQFVCVRRSEVFAVDCDWSDEELGSIPCAYGTAENMLEKAAVGPKDHVLVPGASGGVGSAVVQLAKRRGARVTALCGRAKLAQLEASLGADQVLAGRHGDPDWKATIAALKGTVSVVVDNVGGLAFGDVVDCLKIGGRYVTSGAIGGPLVELDLRTLYLRDLRLIGSTAWEEPVFPNLVRYVESNEIKPVVAKTYPLGQIVEAQTEFLKKTHVGKFVLIP
ncbi:unnamed protein product [Effrenium voratum]|nr:unnamed protein product [Effrenium voratum]